MNLAIQQNIVNHDQVDTIQEMGQYVKIHQCNSRYKQKKKKEIKKTKQNHIRF